MKRFAPIGNETEFQQWLASVLEAERERLREETTTRKHDVYICVEAGTDGLCQEKHREVGRDARESCNCESR
jgi:hypothetical protein